MEVGVGKHGGNARGNGPMLRDARTISLCEVRRLMTPDHTVYQVGPTALDPAGVGRFCRKGLNTGNNKRKS